jgi:hypothetical protein
MSHGRHSMTGEIAHLVADVNSMPPHEAEQFYGFEFNNDKTIYDGMYDKTFKNIYEWAAYVVSQESDEWEDEYDRHGDIWDDEI